MQPIRSSKKEELKKITSKKRFRDSITCEATLQPVIQGNRILCKVFGVLTPEEKEEAQMKGALIDLSQTKIYDEDIESICQNLKSDEDKTMDEFMMTHKDSKAFTVYITCPICFITYDYAFYENHNQFNLFSMHPYGCKTCHSVVCHDCGQQIKDTMSVPMKCPTCRSLEIYDLQAEFITNCIRKSKKKSLVFEIAKNRNKKLFVEY